jgi:hypothetical protein
MDVPNCEVYIVSDRKGVYDVWLVDRFMDQIAGQADR